MTFLEIGSVPESERKLKPADTSVGPKETSFRWRDGKKNLSPSEISIDAKSNLPVLARPEARVRDSSLERHPTKMSRSERDIREAVNTEKRRSGFLRRWVDVLLFRGKFSNPKTDPRVNNAAESDAGRLIREGRVNEEIIDQNLLEVPARFHDRDERRPDFHFFVEDSVVKGVKKDPSLRWAFGEVFRSLSSPTDTRSNLMAEGERLFQGASLVDALELITGYCPTPFALNKRLNTYYNSRIEAHSAMIKEYNDKLLNIDLPPRERLQLEHEKGRSEREIARIERNTTDPAFVRRLKRLTALVYGDRYDAAVAFERLKNKYTAKDGSHKPEVVRQASAELMGENEKKFSIGKQEDRDVSSVERPEQLKENELIISENDLDLTKTLLFRENFRFDSRLYKKQERVDNNYGSVAPAEHVITLLDRENSNEPASHEDVIYAFNVLKRKNIAVRYGQKPRDE